MSAWWREALERAGRGEAAALVTVCSVAGSAPREAGARMLVWNGGQDGTVGGGNLEFTLVDQARKSIASGAAHRFQSYPLGPLLGQCCGGRVGILLERIDAASIGWLTAIAQAEDAGHPYAIHSTLNQDGIARRIVDLRGVAEISGEPVRLSGPDGGPIDIASRIDAKGLTIVERVDPRPLLLMFGAGHVGRALAPLVATLPFRVRWFDNRDEFAAPGVTVADDLVVQVGAAPPGALYLVFTQSHAVDYDLTRAILARDDFLYCGLIGSATKRARFEKRLVADGIPQARLARLVCPIGNIGLASKAPEVLAIAIAAELLLTVQSRAAARRPKVVHGS
ncbi:MAG TPA: xanthine dehydrogenase accessory protein XdhC [Rhizomicrobium sp.]